MFKLLGVCYPESERISNDFKQDIFYYYQWQRSTDVTTFYLLYRWVNTLLFSIALVGSLGDFGQPGPFYSFHNAKWFIYLTSWGLLLCAIQSWLCALFVTKGYISRTVHHGKQKLKLIHHIYWSLYSVSTVYSFLITLFFWTFVYDPVIMPLTPVSLMGHVMNSFLMGIDLAVVKHPVLLKHYLWNILIAVIYTTFTAIYYLAGGTNRRLSPSIYSLLNWSKPGRTIGLAICSVLFMFLLHLIMYYLSRLRIFWNKTREVKFLGNGDITIIHETYDKTRDVQKQHNAYA